MPTPATNLFSRIGLRDVSPIFLLLAYPTIAVVVGGGASAISIAAAVISLGIIIFRTLPAASPNDGLQRCDVWLCIALAAPLAAVIFGALWHGHALVRTWDSPSRFLAAVPIFLVLRRQLPRILSWADTSFALGALSALGVIMFVPRDWGSGRLSSSFLNPIHFGDIALALGVLSIVSLNWWRRDPLPIYLGKVAGLFAGLLVSLISGSRGGWIAIPVVAVMVLYVRSRGKSIRWKVSMTLAIVGVLVAVCGVSGTVRERIEMVSSDWTQYTHGNKDTSLGVRLQLYDAAFSLIRQHPVLGLGGDGFRDAMNSMTRQGALTPVAAQYGVGETHNQLLAYFVDFGAIGGVALLAIYVAPAVFFWGHLNASAHAAQTAALMGLTFVVSFFIFGLTVETFDLKSTVSFYATVLAVLAALASSTGLSSGTPRDASKQ